MVEDRKLAMLVMLRDEYGQARLKATVAVPQDNGELHGISWDNGWYKGSELYGLEVCAYVGRTPYDTMIESERGIWGIGTYYQPHRIENARHAKAIAAAFAKIEKGLDKIRDDEGWLDDRDYAQYVMRVARVLRIKDVYVWRTKQAYDMSGEHYQKVNGSDLQSWVGMLESDVKGGKKQNYLSHR